MDDVPEPEPDLAAEQEAHRRRLEQIREDALRARARTVLHGETIEFVRELGFEELLDDDE